MNDKKTIWIVDDDESIAQVTKLILEQEGYITEAILSEEALKAKFAHSMPNLILIDLRMSTSDGARITKELKDDEKMSSIPIILLSADLDIEKKTKESKANDFIKKPFELTQLLEIVAKYLPS